MFKDAINQLSAGNYDLNQILTYSLYIIILAVIVAVGRFFWRFFFHGVAYKIIQELRDKLFTHMVSLSAGYYDQHKVGDLMARMTNDMEAIRRAAGFSFVALFDGLFLSISILIIMLSQNAQLALICFIPLPFLTTVVLTFGKFIGIRFKKVHEGYSTLTETAQETISGIRVVKTFVQEETFLEKFRQKSEDYTRQNMSLIRLWGLAHPLVELFAGVSLLLFLFFGGKAVIDNTLMPGEFMAFLAYLQMIIWPMLGAGFVVNIIQRGKIALVRVNEILNQKAEIYTHRKKNTIKTNDFIVIKNLNFNYPKNKEQILSRIDLKIKQGETLGILGKTGSGKTTLVKLLPRLLDPPAKSIFLNGQDIRTIELEELRKIIGMVPQDTFLFSSSIFENIAFGNPDVPKETIETVAKISTIAKDLNNFPDKGDTIVGERGVTLSGGQKQRVAISRLLAYEPEILILDDAFSSVDTETEDSILKALGSYLEKRTTILISHRVSTLKNADTIIVLDKGRIVQKGTHEKLLKDKSGFYAEVYQLQQLEDKLRKRR